MVGEVKDFFLSDLLILTIPFKRDIKDQKIYRQQIESVVAQIEAFGIKFVIFCSSTSIYPAMVEWAREDHPIIPDNPRSEILLGVEKFLMQNKRFDTTVIRFAGLYGGSRQIESFHAGKKDLTHALSPVNLIHLDDCIGIIMKIINQDVRREIFNACCDDHPTRKDLYTQAALKLGREPPTFLNEPQWPCKKVSNKKVKERLNYQFKYPHPRIKMMKIRNTAWGINRYE